MKLLRNPFTWVFAGLAFCAGAVAWSSREFARRVVTPSPYPPEPLRILSVDAQAPHPTVTLSRGEDAELAGNYSLIFDRSRGHARVGEVVSQDRRGVTRELLGVQAGELVVGNAARITGWWWHRAEDLGLPYTPWRTVSAGGDITGYLFHPAGKEQRPHTIAVHVHGRGARWQETLRGVTPLAQLGISSLVMSYRNDPEAFASVDGKYGLGTTEAVDVVAACAALAAEGYTRVMLVGWSMGATAVLLAAENVRVREVVQSIVCESPALDWPSVLHHHARLAHLPQPAARLGMRHLERSPAWAGLRAPVPLSGLTVERFASALRVPCLVLASHADTFVPQGPSARFARLRPDLVELAYPAQGEHVKLWNADPHAWEKHLRDFAQRTLC